MDQSSSPPATPGPERSRLQKMGDAVSRDYLFSLPGILNVAEGVLSLIIVITSSVFFPFIALGGGFVQFVSILCLILSAVTFLLYSCECIGKLPLQRFRPHIEFGYSGIFMVLYLISFIISAVNGAVNPATGASAFFTVAVMAVFAVDTFLAFRRLRTHRAELARRPDDQETGQTDFSPGPAGGKI